MAEKEVENVLNRYGTELDSRFANYAHQPSGSEDSAEFIKFKSETMPQLSRYERWCSNLGGIIKLRLSPADEERIQKNLNVAHLDIIPGQVVSLAIVSAFFTFIFGLIFSRIFL